MIDDVRRDVAAATAEAVHIWPASTRGIIALAWNDAAYPPLALAIPDPPPVLW